MRKKEIPKIRDMEELIENQNARKKKNKKKKVAIISVSAVLGVLFSLFLTLYFVAGNYFFLFALDARYETLSKAPDIEEINEMPLPDVKASWFKEAPKTIQTIESDDGYKLRAYQILADNTMHKWVITVHGYRGNARDTGHFAEAYYNKGFNVLMIDLKGHGLSEGKYVGMGYTDRLDLLKWIDFVIQQDPIAKIVLHGVSMGAATVMLATGESLPENVKCAVEDCGYSNVYDEFKYVAKRFLGLPFINTLISSVNVFAQHRMNIDLRDVDCVEAVKKSITPTMFIHGNQDTFVPFSMLDKLYNANPDLEKKKLIVDGASHGYSATLEPELYFSEVFDFVNNYI